MHLKKEWVQLAGLFLGLRCIYSLVGAVAGVGIDPRQISDPMYHAVAAILHYDKFSQLFVNVWFRWDTGWFLKVAAFGYGAQDNSTAFMPLYPWLIRGVNCLLGKNYLLAALVVSNAACLVCLILLYEIACQEGLNKDAALRTVMFLLLFPTSFYLFAGYSEALYLALLLGAWLLARRKIWLAAGVLAALATLCRSQGIVMVVVLLWAFLSDCAGGDGKKPIEQIRQITALVTTRTGRASLLTRLKKPDWLAILFPLLTLVGYNTWLQLSGMKSVTTAHAQGWGRVMVMPWKGVQLLLERLVYGQHVSMDYIDLSMYVLALGLSIYGLFRLNTALSLYNWLTLAIVLMVGSDQLLLLLSFSRIFLAFFPLFFLLGEIRSRPLRFAFWFVSFTLQIFLLFVFLNFGWVA